VHTALACVLNLEREASRFALRRPSGQALLAAARTAAAPHGARRHAGRAAQAARHTGRTAPPAGCKTGPATRHGMRGRPSGAAEQPRRGGAPVLRPSAPSSLTPVVNTSPPAVSAALCMPPAATCTTCARPRHCPWIRPKRGNIRGAAVPAGRLLPQHRWHSCRTRWRKQGRRRKCGRRGTNGPGAHSLRGGRRGAPGRRPPAAARAWAAAPRSRPRPCRTGRSRRRPAQTRRPAPAAARAASGAAGGVGGPGRRAVGLLAPGPAPLGTAFPCACQDCG